MESMGRVIAEARERMVEEKVRKMLKERKKEDKRKEERLEELEEEVGRLKRKVERMERSGSKRKRDDSEESGAGKRKWWAGEDERSEEELRKKNVIIRIEKKKWEGKKSNWEKVKELFAEGLKVRVEIRDVRVVGQRGDWLTILVKLGDEEEKWRVLEARRKAADRVGLKIGEDKSVERRDKEREDNERRVERRREENRSLGRSVEDEVAREMEEKLLMDSGEEKEDKKKRL